MIATELKNHRAKLKQNMNPVERWLFEHSYAGYNLRAFLYGRDHRLLGIGRKKFLPTLKSDLTYRYEAKEVLLILICGTLIVIFYHGCPRR